VVTIGVYGFDLEGFIAGLRKADVHGLLDVRQRRGVRGSEYAWANSLRLQAALAATGIAYEHHLQLAPTTELRRLQYAEDDRQRIGRRARVQLAAEYVQRYTTEVLDVVDLTALASSLPTTGGTALLCVETLPRACHRSLIADRLAHHHGATVTHIHPQAAPPAPAPAPHRTNAPVRRLLSR